MSLAFPPPGSNRAVTVTDARACIHEIFELQAAKSPNRIAVACGAENLTYRELNERANQLAHYLRRLGVGPERPVALYLDRSLEMVVAILGVLKAAGVYVPIDLAYPEERAGFMLEDTAASVLLTQSDLAGRLPASRSQIVCLDADPARIQREPKDCPGHLAGANNAAYIIYTSGSTGKPKGVVVTHHNVVRLLDQTAKWYQFNQHDVWPLFHSYAFDVSVWELWGCLFNGGRLVVVPYLVTRSPAEFYELLAREKMTVLNQTPSAFRQLIWAEQGATQKGKLSLRYVICAGEALELQSLKPWFDLHGDERPRVVNMYGITETTVHSTYRVIRKTDLTNGSGSVIGVPIPDLQIHLLDSELKTVPAGAPGEIFVGGAGVARGYLNRPELTRQRFIPDPFSTVPGARMYRSGDLAQVNARGELEYLGRMDCQVKIRGFRVELGEIESALNQHPAVRESVVIAQQTSAEDKQLVAYLVARGESPTVSDLREYLQPKLPDYMLPAVFVFLGSLPLTTNGKVDRKALPAPPGFRPELKQAFVKPGNATEEMLAGIWATVLEIDRVGVHDNFFDLGGDSIRAIRVLSKIQQNGWRLPLEHIFRQPTVAGIAEFLDKQEREVASFASRKPFSLVHPEDRRCLPSDAEDAYPIGKMQLGMFYHNELEPDSAMYHDVFSYRIRASFDLEKLACAISALVTRHPILRTSFHLAGYRTALQVVHRKVTVPLTIEDLRGREAADQEQNLLNWIESEKRRPFDRAVAPLWRLHIQRRSETEFQFVFSFHHSCIDGWSLASAITEILQAYSAILSGQMPRIEAPRVSYADYIALEQIATHAEGSRAFWAGKMAEATTPMLPRWPKSTCAGGREQKRGPEVLIEPKVLDGLKALATQAGVPLRTVLLAGHQRVMAFACGQTDITTGLIVNGRPEELDGENVLGLFLNTVPLRQQLRGGTWEKLVAETFAAEQELMPHRRMPLAEIQKTCGAVPFETAFDFVHFHVLKKIDPSRGVEVTEGPYFEANNLTAYTTLMLDVESTRLELHIDYDPNVVALGQVELLTRYYLNTFAAMAANPTANYLEFSPLTAEESLQLQHWNTTGAQYPGERRIDDLISDRAKETPDAVAVVFGEQSLTYRDLERRATALAVRLEGQGVEPGRLVGLCLDRSAEMVVALLAVLKAGGAYAPLDPLYPRERLGFMIEHSRLGIVVTQRSALAALPEKSGLTLCLVDDETPKGSPNQLASPSHNSGDLAYVMYTSGSTGRPKGVEVTHRAVVNLLLSVAQTARITAADNLLAVTTLSFDIAGLELWLPLIMGGTVTVASREAAGDGTQLAGLIESSSATVMQGTPATWRLLIEAGWAGSSKLKIFCGGEALQRFLADALLARGVEVWNFYGPTETTIWSTASQVLPDEPITIGRPLANTQVYILNNFRQHVPVGTVGEVYIGGEGVARGYLRQPELTAERFLPDPFSRQTESRVYRTGDLARFLPDGRIEWLGRVDDQVKIRGFRIELGEVESALRQHAAVADARVVAGADALGEKRLVGYVVSKNGPPVPSELRDFLRSKLPPYMVPAAFVALKQFPLTPNGKLDRARLPSPGAAEQSGKPYVAPRTTEEKGLAEIWQEVLMVARVGLDDNFFDLGGDSLSATRAFARANKVFGMQLTLREILDRPTIRSLAELTARTRGTVQTDTPAIPRQPRAPLSDPVARQP